MKLTNEVCAKVYSAIHEPITQLRLAQAFPARVDIDIAQLELKIWDGVRLALETSTTPKTRKSRKAARS